MRVIIADCDAHYSGRGETYLPRGVRSVLLKSDGSVSIHNDVSNKPLNYMKQATFTQTVNHEGHPVWNFDTRKESLAITIFHKIGDMDFPLIQDDPGLQRDGTEDHIQEWLSYYPDSIEEGLVLVRREYETGNGPVDLMFLDQEGTPVAVEVKRTAMIGAVDQMRRYRDALRDPEVDSNKNNTTMEAPLNFDKLRTIIVALDIRPKTVDYAKKHNIELVDVCAAWQDYKDNREAQPLPSDVR